MIRVDVETIDAARMALKGVDSIPIEEIEWYEDGVKIDMSPEILEEWKFVGMNNSTFGEMRYWRLPTTPLNTSPL